MHSGGRAFSQVACAIREITAAEYAAKSARAEEEFQRTPACSDICRGRQRRAGIIVQSNKLAGQRLPHIYIITFATP